MRSSFSYGRRGKCYRYYVSAAGDGVGESGPVTRVAAEQLEKWVLQTLGRLTHGGGPASPAALNIVRRVEIHRRSTHLVLSARALGEPHEGLSSIITRLEAKLVESRLVAEAHDLVRLIAERCAVFRGGKTEAGTAPPSASMERSMQVLRSAHRLLGQHFMSPLDPGRHPEATAPDYQRLRRAMALGLLAPDVQRDVLLGRRQISVLATTSPLPLAWADHRNLVT